MDFIKKQNKFSSGQVAVATGIEYHHVHHWAKTGFIIPSIQVAQGSTTCRVYSYFDLICFGVIKRLSDVGISLQTLRPVIKYLKKRNKKTFKGVYLVITKEKVTEATEEQLLSIIKDSDACCFLSLESVVNQVAKNVLNLKKPSRGRSSKAVK